MELNVIATPLQGLRDVLDLMPTATQDDWATIATRLSQCRAPSTSGRRPCASRPTAGSSPPAAGRGVRGAVRRLTAPDGFFADLPRRARLTDAPLDESVRRDLRRGVEARRRGLPPPGRDLRDDLLHRAPEPDAVGRERYALASRRFLGAPRSTSRRPTPGGRRSSRGSRARWSATADRIVPGGSVAEAIDHLDRDPAYQLHGTEALRDWMQERADEVVADLVGTHFDIPEQVRTHRGTDRPDAHRRHLLHGPERRLLAAGPDVVGRAEGVTEFGTWRELTTVYHEGVPGHHLQVGQTVCRRELLNRWRRQLCWVSGHGEGWALYAERLMAELGYMDDPGNHLGLLDGQSLRAARVVLDIGVHCGFEAPAEVGGGAWTYDKAWAFLTAHAHEGEQRCARAAPVPRLAGAGAQLQGRRAAVAPAPRRGGPPRGRRVLARGLPPPGARRRVGGARRAASGRPALTHRPHPPGYRDVRSTPSSQGRSLLTPRSAPDSARHGHTFPDRGIPRRAGGAVAGTRGRRPAGSGTREAILAAASRAFAEQGYPRTTPARHRPGRRRRHPARHPLLRHQAGPVRRRRRAAVRPRPVVMAVLLAPGPDGVGHRLATFAVGMLETPDARRTMTGPLRAAAPRRRRRCGCATSSWPACSPPRPPHRRRPPRPASRPHRRADGRPRRRAPHRGTPRPRRGHPRGARRGRRTRPPALPDGRPLAEDPLNGENPSRGARRDRRRHRPRRHPRQQGGGPRRHARAHRAARRRRRAVVRARGARAHLSSDLVLYGLLPPAPLRRGAVDLAARHQDEPRGDPQPLGRAGAVHRPRRRRRGVAAPAHPVHARPRARARSSRRRMPWPPRPWPAASACPAGSRRSSRASPCSTTPPRSSRCAPRWPRPASWPTGRTRPRGRCPR